MELTFAGLRRHQLLFAAPVDLQALARLDRFFEVEVTGQDDLLDAAVLAARLAGKSALIAVRTARIDARLLASLPYLKAVCKAAPSHDDVDLDACTRARVIVTNADDVREGAAGARQMAQAAADNVIAAFGFGRASSHPRNLLNTELRCLLGCCA
ncbi:MAG: hypothetical protein ABI881_04360 [Betaproteobacteria bacterium]